LLRYRRRDAVITLVAFDLIELDGRDLRREPIETRKAELSRLLAGCRPGLVVNSVFDNPGLGGSATGAVVGQRGRRGIRQP
jgi:ATP-dependent DNA ligase